MIQWQFRSPFYIYYGQKITHKLIELTVKWQRQMIIWKIHIL